MKPAIDTPIVPDTAPESPPNIIKKPAALTKKQKKMVVIGSLSALAMLLLILVVAGIYSYNVVSRIRPQISVMQATATEAYAGLKNQDLATAKSKLEVVKQQVQTLESDYGKLGFWRYTPLTWHYGDGHRVIESAKAGLDAAMLLVNAVEPYADVIGFQGQGSFVGGTAEDRIVKIMETLDVVTPSLDQVIAKLDFIDSQVSEINPARYPFSYQGQSVSDLITTTKITVDQANSLITQIKPIIQVLPSVAGVDEPKRYLVLFQNDGELRPTGGFLTAYALLKTEKGKVSPEKSDDIYDLDAKFRKRITPPLLLGKYLNQTRWNLRDMNTNPDFKLSMDTFMEHYLEIPGEGDVDGVVAIDTQVLADLLKALGPVDVPGYGVFTAENDPRCDCPQVIYLLEDISTKPTPYFRSERKAVLGPLMQTILFKAYGAPKQIWPQLFQSIWNSINEKHVLFYFYDEAAQQAVEANNLAGRIKAYDGDYLHINDANLGGAKSNMFISQTVEQTVTTENGQLKKVVSITYKNPQKGSNCNLEAGQLCLNGKMPSWLRVFVPKGSTLTSIEGGEEAYNQSYDEGDKTVFETMYTLNPESQTKIILTYTVPLDPGDEYRLLIQKQPGTKLPEHTITVNGNYHDPVILNTDKELKFAL